MAEQADDQLVWTQVLIRVVYSIFVAFGVLHVLFISMLGKGVVCSTLFFLLGH